MPRLIICLLVAIWQLGALPCWSQEKAAQKSRLAPPTPTKANVKYGEHEMHVLDFWEAKGDAPKPLALHIHGGGFVGGDKTSLNAGTLKQLLDSGIHASSAILRAYALPPAVPKERLTTLRDAFMATMKDKDFAAEITKANLELNPLSGAEVENIVRKLYQVDANLAGKLKEILVPKK